MNTFQIAVVGAGISGAVLAERYASCLNKKVLVLEKRDHIGGNCYDYINEYGLLVAKYGAHLFHTNYEDVWDYVNRFSEWFPYEHRVKARVDGMLVPVPVNITTVNMLLGENIQTEEEMHRWLDAHQVKNENPKDGKQAALARVGPVLYEKLFKHYTRKQWAKYPEQLDPSVLQRLPVRGNFDDRYFSDKYQALPKEGYTRMFERILDHPNIEVRLNTDFFAVRDEIERQAKKLFYTGPIDQFFGCTYNPDEKLEYRSINFVWDHPEVEFYQENAVVNYPSPEVDFTRIVEYKHFYRDRYPQGMCRTSISREFTTGEGEPYYPVPNPQNMRIFAKYQREVEKLKNIFFVGRLANYKYFNMDQAFKNALDLFERIEGMALKTA